MIYRNPKDADHPFAQIDKQLINDRRLSWKAKGLMLYLLSKPDDWQVIIGDLVNHARDSEGSTRNGINELIQFGYIKREPIRDKQKGYIKSWQYDIAETPDFFTSLQKTTLSKSTSGKPTSGKFHPTNKDINNIEITKKENTDVFCDFNLNKEDKNETNQSRSGYKEYPKRRKTTGSTALDKTNSIAEKFLNRNNK